MDARVEASGNEFGSVGTELLYSDRHINVWAVDVAPGRVHPMHHHRFPYVVISAASATVQVVAEDGVLRAIEESPGIVVLRPPGEIHEFHNTGTTWVKDRLIEYKIDDPADWANIVLPNPSSLP